MRSRKLRGASCLLALSLLLHPLAAAAHQQITNVRIIDGTGSHVERGWIEIQQQRITAVGVGEPTSLSNNYIDGRGMTAMPGFIDTHRHLFAYSNIRSNAALQRYMRHELPSLLSGLLHAGFTTILSPGDHSPEIFQVRSRLHEGSLVGPRLLAVGRILHAPNDHPVATLCRGNRYCRAKLSAVVANAKRARARVRELVNDGADMIKAVHDRELAKRVVIDDALIAVIADEAQRHGVPFLLHTRDSADFLRLVNLGTRRVAHTPLIGSIAQHATADQVRYLQTNGVAVQTTLSWASQETVSAQGRRPSADDLARLQQGQRNVRFLVDQGLAVAFGTDNPPPLGRLSFMPEVRTLSEVLSNAEIIQAMTHGAAVFLQRENDIGAIRPGMIADIVLLDGNPLIDLTALQRVSQVWQGGHAIGMPP